MASKPAYGARVYAGKTELRRKLCAGNGYHKSADEKCWRTGIEENRYRRRVRWVPERHALWRVVQVWTSAAEEWSARASTAESIGVKGRGRTEVGGVKVGEKETYSRSLDAAHAMEGTITAGREQGQRVLELEALLGIGKGVYVRLK